MKLAPGIGICALALAASLSASTIDVTSQATLLLQSGDSLIFLFSGNSYATNATGLGMSPWPGSIDFTFASAPIVTAGQFTAQLESEDGEIFAAFPGPIGWASGDTQSSGYSGPVSTVTDSLAHSNAVSQEVFSGSDADLVLTYTGPDVNLGMPGNNLRQDVWVSLSGGPLSVGGLVYSVMLDNNGEGVQESHDLPPAPEPNSGALLFAAGAGFCGIAWTLKRFAAPTPPCG